MASRKDTDIINSTIKLFSVYRITLFKYVLIGTFLISLFLLTPRILSGNNRPILILVGIFGIIALYLLLRWPILGLFFTLIGSMFLPFSWQGGFNLSEIGIAATLGICLINIFLLKRYVPIKWSNIFLPLIAFVVISILSFCMGQFRWYLFADNAPLVTQIGGLSINLLSIGAFVLVVLLITDIRKLELFTWTFIFFGLLYILGRFLNLGIQDRLYESGFTSGSLFWTWLVSLLAGQIIMNRHLDFRLRVLLSILLIMTLYVAIGQAYDWKSGWFPPLIGISVILGMKYWRYIKYVAFLGVIPLYYIVINSIGAEDYSWGTRLDAWTIVLQIAQASPILGLGFANYYWYTPLFPIRGWYVRFNSHSQFVDLIAQSGVVGLACFLWIFFEAGRLVLRLRDRVPEGFPRAYVFGAFGGLVGTFVAGWLVDWILPFAYNIGMNGFRASMLAWLFLGGLAALEQIIQREPQRSIIKI